MFDFLSSKFSSIFNKFTGKNTLTQVDVDTALFQVKEALLEADVPYQLVDQFCTEINKDVIGQKLIGSVKPNEQLIKVVHDRMVSFLGGKQDIPFSFQIPSIIMVLGLQGSGKTTSIAKIAHFIQKEAQQKGKKRTILLASIDFYRPAAVDQLEVVAGKAGVAFYRAISSDPVQAAKEIYNYYKQEKFEFLFLDTAGRLHIDSHMIEELRRVEAAIEPRYKLLVLDAMTGQESFAVAQAFEQSLGFSHAMLSKLDSDTRGGAAFAFRYALKKPILFAGIGEKVDDIERFYPERMAGRILGMGDVLTLVEKANEKIKESEQERLAKAFNKGKLTLQDFAEQIEMMNKIGSMSHILKYIPGVNKQNISSDMIEKGEVELKKFRAIIQSMTLKERSNQVVIDPSRKLRIARGAGVSQQDINTLLDRFEQSQQYVKLLKKFGRFPNLF
ncbi:signal recognition particle protein [Candidatus Dependentiae bacterium Noda2021]|nr:signal recognition particle protein [Candidatus Dependentiae bacterium Noda2021]